MLALCSVSTLTCTVLACREVSSPHDPFTSVFLQATKQHIEMTIGAYQSSPRLGFSVEQTRLSLIQVGWWGLEHRKILRLYLESGQKRVESTAP